MYCNNLILNSVLECENPFCYPFYVSSLLHLFGNTLYIVPGTRTVFPSIQIIIYRASVLVGTYRQYRYVRVPVQTMIISGGGERAENSTALQFEITGFIPY